MNIYEKLFRIKEKSVIVVRDQKAFNYSYATLNQIQEVLHPILKEQKLVILHFVRDWNVVTQIRDIESEGFVESSIEIWEVKSEKKERFISKAWKDIETTETNSKDPQWVWSILTYYRRYNLISLLDIWTEDDDGKNWSLRAQMQEVEIREKPEFTTDVFVKFKENEDYQDYVEAKKVIEKKYTITINAAKKLKTFYENKNVDLGTWNPLF